jgi:tRNA pseudouridine38-40 synthase
MRIALGLQYDGSVFYGWQSQIGLPTVQSAVESALSEIANEKIRVFCAGRTDAGVHACNQVIHFETNTHRELYTWIKGTNRFLPKHVSVNWAQAVDDKFHARHKASARTYCYVIYNHPIRSAILADKVSLFHSPLDIERMKSGAAILVGEHDFSSFRAAKCDAKSPIKKVHYIHITQHKKFIFIEIKANAFLHHMVRNIVGTLFTIGSAVQPPEWMHQVLMTKDRQAAAVTAPAAGLYFLKVDYPEVYQFPNHAVDFFDSFSNS